MSITIERFMQFADLALAAFNSKNEEIQRLGEQVVSLTEQLAIALANDKADADKIVQAEADAEAAKAALAKSIEDNEKASNDLVTMINELQTKLGISTLPIEPPVDETPVEPPVDETPVPVEG